MATAAWPPLKKMRRRLYVGLRPDWSLRLQPSTTSPQSAASRDHINCTPSTGRVDNGLLHRWTDPSVHGRLLSGYSVPWPPFDASCTVDSLQRDLLCWVLPPLSASAYWQSRILSEYSRLVLPYSPCAQALRQTPVLSILAFVGSASCSVLNSTHSVATAIS
jgi:hypothetical protein